MTTSIREWSNLDFSNHATDQETLQNMARDILSNAETIENNPTPGYDRPNLSRVIVAKNTMVPDLEYIIHIDGFTVSNITEIHRH